MKKNPNQNNRGYIALMSAIIISAILILVAVTTSFKGFYGRFNVLDAEFKERSVALAEACADHALLSLANDIYSYDTAGDTITINGNTCTISLATPAGASSEKTFRTQAFFPNVTNGAYTNLEIKVNTSDISIVSWKEIPTYTP